MSAAIRDEIRVRIADKAWVDAKFWARVEQTDTCWLWRGGLMADGYGQIHLGRFDKKSLTFRTHRFSWLLAGNELDPELCLDHLCKTRPCCNPKHLEQVTVAENNRRAWAHLTHCKYGHPFVESNIILRGPLKTARLCRTCYNRSQRAIRARKKAGR